MAKFGSNASFEKWVNWTEVVLIFSEIEKYLLVSTFRKEDDAFVVAGNLHHRLAPLQILLKILRRVVRTRTVFRQGWTNDQKFKVFLSRTVAVLLGSVSRILSERSWTEIGSVFEIEMRQRSRSPEVPVSFASRQNPEPSFSNRPNGEPVTMLLLLLRSWLADFSQSSLKGKNGFSKL